MSTDTHTESLPDVDSLWYGCEDSKSREYDWSRGYGEEWTSYEATEVACTGGTVDCDQCDGGEVDQHDGSSVPCEVCEGTGERPCTFEGAAVVRSGYWTCPECEQDHDSDSCEGPMMNYYYPLPDHADIDPAAAALKLAHLPLCVVSFQQDGYGWSDAAVDGDLPAYALALTGGGMDLSWQIAEAHMRLGYMPPAFACDLPNFAGMDTASPVNAWIIAGCRRTARAIMQQGERIIEKMDRLERTDS